jgi:hypothetical protein
MYRIGGGASRVWPVAQTKFRGPRVWFLVRRRVCEGQDRDGMPSVTTHDTVAVAAVGACVVERIGGFVTGRASLVGVRSAVVASRRVVSRARLRSCFRGCRQSRSRSRPWRWPCALAASSTGHLFSGSVEVVVELGLRRSALGRSVLACDIFDLAIPCACDVWSCARVAPAAAGPQSFFVLSVGLFVARPTEYHVER